VISLTQAPGVPHYLVSETMSPSIGEVPMAARKPVFLRWVEEAEARRLCERAVLEAEPVPLADPARRPKPASSMVYGSGARGLTVPLQMMRDAGIPTSLVYGVRSRRDGRGLP
jgi:hypothetical protein